MHSAKQVVPVKNGGAKPENDFDFAFAGGKRILLAASTDFRTVVLGFFKMSIKLGKRFADEIFRVFARGHPGIDVQFKKHE